VGRIAGGLFRTRVAGGQHRSHVGNCGRSSGGTMRQCRRRFAPTSSISRDQIARNFRAVRDLVGPGVEVAAVVKADAYCHGALEISRVVLAEVRVGSR